MISIGLSIQTERVLQQAVIERIKPAVFLDNMEGALLELQMGQEDLYQTLHRVVENFNTVITTYMYADIGGSMGTLVVRQRERRGKGEGWVGVTERGKRERKRDEGKKSIFATYNSSLSSA